ncbi:MAG: DUF4127 family protein [Candidatus Eremiobacteraeota bacterium]|nr:DUF4127 family protein [Candidatus Eremiobacteraeota bacterium]
MKSIGRIAFSLMLLGVVMPCIARARAPIAFVPLDDRPVTRQLPALLGTIAGRNVLMPPRADLGNYLTAGNPEAIIAWLNGDSARGAADFVASTDMLAYGGLVASRIPGVRYADAEFRLRELNHVRAQHPRAWIGAFGTIMRLAPTGVPALGPAKNFFAAYPAWKYIQEYANLHDPPLPSEIARAQTLRSLIGEPTLQAYLDTRTRNLEIDLKILQMTAAGTMDTTALGQDDAGPVGLHLKDVRALQAEVAQLGIADRTAIEPGADELGMAMIAQALDRGIGWTPRVTVRYSMPDGATYHDPLEFAPIAVAIDGLIRLCGGVHDDAAPDLTLYVRVPQTDAAHDAALLGAMHDDLASGKSVAFADLTFLGGTFAPQAQFVEAMMREGIAGKIDAYSSWNTNANTVGTALAEAIAAGVGRRTHAYDALAHADFTFDRYMDDYLFHDYVRPDLNTTLNAQGIPDHTYLLPGQASPLTERNNAELWNRAVGILGQIYPGYHIAAMQITLPWDRTFETEIEVRLAPNLPT